jgi:[ribosomal protein S18]-alanine N-acetyltransferase
VLNPHIRFVIDADMPSVMAIENASFPQPWSEGDFASRRKRRNCISFVAEVGRKVVGYAVLEHGDKTTELVNIAVHPEFRRQRIASRLMAKVIEKSRNRHEFDVRAEVRESNTLAHLLLRSLGLKAFNVVREMYHDTGESGYIFAVRHALQAEGAATGKSANRS